MNRKYFVIGPLIGIVLLTMVFIPISSQQGVHDYDPWADLNDDGKIDGRDIAGTSARFGTLGTPINKTELLLELQSKVAELETKVNILNATKLRTPDYDSGWVAISQGQAITLLHNLNTDPAKLFVYILGWSSDFGVHQLYLGGDNSGLGWSGLLFYGLGTQEITVLRGQNDGFWSEVRVMLWKIGEQTSTGKTWHFVANFTLSNENPVSPLFFIQGEKWRIRWHPQQIQSWYGFAIWDENGYALEEVSVAKILGEHHEATGIHYVPYGNGSYQIESFPGPSVNYTVESYH